MLYRMEKLIGLSITASDGEIGKVKDVYFDDQHWAVRYLVVETGGWLDHIKVLVSPFAVRRIDWDGGSVHVHLTRAQVKGSPSVDTDRPVSRQQELEFSRHYGYPGYWSGALLWGDTPYLTMPSGPVSVANDSRPGCAAAAADAHLRSAKQVIGYHLQATDAAIGHVEDFLVEDESWAIRYLVIDTRNWWPGKHVVIPPQWISTVDWAGQSLHMNVTRYNVTHAPEYDPAVEFTRPEEASLYRHYERANYWD